MNTFPPPFKPSALILASTRDTRSPSTWTCPPIWSELDTSIEAWAIVTLSSSTWTCSPVWSELDTSIEALFVNITLPSASTLMEVACSLSPPVKTYAKNPEPKFEVSFSFTLFGSNSKLNKCPGWDILTIPLSSTAAMVILPPGLDSGPVLMTVPPNKVRFSPGFKLRFPWLTIWPNCSELNLYPLGFPTNFE